MEGVTAHGAVFIFDDQCGAWQPRGMSVANVDTNIVAVRQRPAKTSYKLTIVVGFGKHRTHTFWTLRFSRLEGRRTSLRLKIGESDLLSGPAAGLRGSASPTLGPV